MDKDFNYADAFNSLDLAAVKQDLHALMTDSQAWWPADFGHYGGLFIRMAGTAPAPTASATAAAAQAKASSASPRSTAGRTTSASTRRAVCCGLSSRNTAATSPRADLIILTGNVALESMGFKTFGYAGGRADTGSRTTSTGALRRSGWS